MSELKRCPICNGEVKLMFMNEESFVDCVWDEDVGNVPTWFKCYECDSEFFHDEPIDTPEKQIEWWNTRKPIERIVELLEEEQEKLDTDMFARECDNWHGQLCNGISEGLYKAIEIVKEGGMNDNT